MTNETSLHPFVSYADDSHYRHLTFTEDMAPKRAAGMKTILILQEGSIHRLASQRVKFNNGGSKITVEKKAASMGEEKKERGWCDLSLRA